MDIDLSNLGNYYSSIANQSVGNGKNISNLTDGKLNGKSDDELMDVCKSFEAYFLEQVFICLFFFRKRIVSIITFFFYFEQLPFVFSSNHLNQVQISFLGFFFIPKISRINFNGVSLKMGRSPVYWTL